MKHSLFNCFNVVFVLLLVISFLFYLIVDCLLVSSELYQQATKQLYHETYRYREIKSLRS